MQNDQISTVETSIEAAAQPDFITVETSTPGGVPAKRARKPRAAKQAKPEAAPAKPVKLTAEQRQAATDAKRASAEAQRTERQADIDALRDTARRFYAGASLAAHRAKPSPRDAYVARAVSPAQQCRDGVLTPRDESGLALLLSGADKAGTFDPMRLAFDVGILSRLASVDLVAYVGASDSFTLTEAGRNRARAIVKRAAKPATA